MYRQVEVDRGRMAWELIGRPSVGAYGETECGADSRSIVVKRA